MDLNDCIEIDGSFGEGGGAILRLSAGYSVLFNRPIKIKNIRANRPKPGLRLQHLLGLKSLAELTNSDLSNCNIGSTEIYFTPNTQIKKKIDVNISTAASIGLLLQPIQIASMGLNTDGIEINLSGGGTFGKWAPSLNYLKEVTYKLFKNIGLNIEVDIIKQGYYPKGGSKVKYLIKPPKKPLGVIEITELGNIDLIEGEIIISNHLRQKGNDIPTRIIKSIKRQLKRIIEIETDIRLKWVESSSPGVGLTLWAKSDTGAIISSGTILGERKITSEKLGELAANELIQYITNNIPVDNYLSDQLIPLMAQIKEPSKIRVLKVTSHTKTNIELTKQFINRDFEIIKEKNNSFIITCS